MAGEPTYPCPSCGSDLLDGYAMTCTTEYPARFVPLPGGGAIEGDPGAGYTKAMCAECGEPVKTGQITEALRREGE